MSILVACAPASAGSANATSAPSAPVTQDASTNAPQSRAFSATPERVWAALPRAYKSVGLTVNGVDTVTRTMGFAGIIRHQLGGVRLSKYFGCGNQMGENADAYDITIYVASQVASNPQTRRILVTTGLRVSGRSPAFASTFTICTTKGELERRIMDAIKKEVEG